MQFLSVTREAASALVTPNMERLSHALSRVGRHEKAVVARHNVICCYRTLVEERAGPEFLPLLVRALIEQSQDLRFIQQPKLALSALRQAEQYNNVLAQQDADISAELEGRRLACLAFTLLNGKDISAALDAAKAAMEHYQKLVASGRVTFREELAGNLINLSAALCSVGSYAEGKESARKAVDWFRQLATEDPERHELDLAQSLYNLTHAWLREPLYLGEGSMILHIAEPLTEEERAQSRRAMCECGAILLRCRRGADPYRWVALARATAIRLDRAEHLRNWHLPLLAQIVEYRELAIGAGFFCASL